MRNLHLEKTLELLGHESADTLNTLLEQGAELKYEVLGPDDGSPLCQYEPLTAQFVRNHGSELQRLESFKVASDAISQTELAGPYLEEMGIDVPAHPDRRSDIAILAFLCRLWDGSGEFVFDDGAFEAAYREIESCSQPASGEAEVVVPLFGLQMDLSRIDVAGVAIVRADTVEVPAEARRGEGSGRAAWEPVFLATAKIDLGASRRAEEEGNRDPVAETFNHLVTTLRLFKEGSVGIGPHAWVAVGDERWRRVATGAARPRAGHYRLSDEEVIALADFARAIARRPSRIAALERAISRFEAGLERRVVLDSLNDHLLSLRFLLDGEGSAGFGFAMRVAALAVEFDDRASAKASIEASLALERQLWSGEPASNSTAAPAQLARDIEDMARSILMRSVAGELPAELRAVADEILLGTGVEQPTSGPSGGGDDPSDFDDQGDATDRTDHGQPITSARYQVAPEPSPVAGRDTGSIATLSSQETQEFSADFVVPATGLDALLAGVGAGSAPDSSMTPIDMPNPIPEFDGEISVEAVEPTWAPAPEGIVSPAEDLAPEAAVEPEPEASIETELQAEVEVAPDPEPELVSGPEQEFTYEPETTLMEAEIEYEEGLGEIEQSDQEEAVNPPAWLDEVGAPKTSEWPIGSPELRAEAATSEPHTDMSRRVSFLFPRPETTEWSIGDAQGRLGAKRSA